MKLYRATSLDDIARKFRDYANAAQQLMNKELNRDKRNHYAGEVVTWHAAATMLENMEIVPIVEGVKQ